MSNEVQPLTRLCIIQESGMQLGTARYETHIHTFVAFDDELLGKQLCAEMNRTAELPFYLAKVEVRLIGKMEKYTDARLIQEGIEPFGQ